MANKRREMTPYESSLFAEMKKLSKRANQRIVRLERETGFQEGFATKQLADYLSTDALNAWTPKGRVAVKSSLSAFEMKKVIKATKKFLNQETSRVAGVKAYQKRYEDKTGLKLTKERLNALFQAERNYTWIYDYFGASEKTAGGIFWDWEREHKNDDFETWLDNIRVYVYDRILDEKLYNDLLSLYEYAKGVNG